MWMSSPISLRNSRQSSERPHTAWHMQEESGQQLMSLSQSQSQLQLQLALHDEHDDVDNQNVLLNDSAEAFVELPGDSTFTESAEIEQTQFSVLTGQQHHNHTQISPPQHQLHHHFPSQFLHNAPYSYSRPDPPASAISDKNGRCLTPTLSHSQSDSGILRANSNSLDRFLPSASSSSSPTASSSSSSSLFFRESPSQWEILDKEERRRRDKLRKSQKFIERREGEEETKMKEAVKEAITDFRRGRNKFIEQRAANIITNKAEEETTTKIQKDAAEDKKEMKVHHATTDPSTPTRRSSRPPSPGATVHSPGAPTLQMSASSNASALPALSSATNNEEKSAVNRKLVDAFSQVENSTTYLEEIEEKDSQWLDHSHIELGKEIVHETPEIDAAVAEKQLLAEPCAAHENASPSPSHHSSSVLHSTTSATVFTSPSVAHAEFVSLRRSYDALLASHENLRLSYSKLVSAHQSNLSQLQSTSFTLSESQRENAALRRRESQLREKVLDFERRANDAVDEREKLQGKVKEWKERVTEMEEERRKRNEEAREKEKKRREAEKYIRMLEVQLDAARQTHQKLRRKTEKPKEASTPSEIERQSLNEGTVADSALQKASNVLQKVRMQADQLSYDANKYAESAAVPAQTFEVDSAQRSAAFSSSLSAHLRSSVSLGSSVDISLSKVESRLTSLNVEKQLLISEFSRLGNGLRAGKTLAEREKIMSIQRRMIEIEQDISNCRAQLRKHGALA